MFPKREILGERGELVGVCVRKKRQQRGDRKEDKSDGTSRQKCSPGHALNRSMQKLERAGQRVVDSVDNDSVNSAGAKF